MPAEDVAARRLAQGAAAVLSMSEAAELLPMKDADARRLLRDRGLVRRLEGRDVVIWGEVLAAIQAGDPPAPTPRARRGRAPGITLPVEPLN